MKKFLAFVVIAALAFIGYSHKDQVLVRFSCADKIARQYTTTQPVPGAWDCVDPNTQYALLVLYDVKNAKDFAAALGNPNTSESYLGETADGGYTYRFDTPILKHDSFKTIKEEIWNWKWVWKWNKHDWQTNPGQIWAELNGDTQGWASMVATYYLYPSGTSEMAIATGKTVDVSGKLATVQ